MNLIVKSTVFAISFSAMTAAGYAQSNTQTAAAGPAMQLVEINNAEVALGKTASGKTQNPAVKLYADMMIRDHSAALTKLRDVQGVTTTDMKPNAQHQATADRLSKLSGAEFDREYIATMVSGHQDALEFLEKQSKLTNSTAPPAASDGKTSLASVSEEMIPTVREHLQQAQKLQQDLAANTISNR